MGVPPNGWFIMDNLLKMDDLGGYPYDSGNLHIHIHAQQAFLNGEYAEMILLYGDIT